MNKLAKVLPFPVSWPTEEQFAQADREKAALRAAEERQRLASRIEALENMLAPRRLTRRLGSVHGHTEAMAKLADIGHDRVVVLVGPKGIGKTMAALHWLAHARGRPWFARAPQWAATAPWVREWEGAKVAVVDDLGTEDLDGRFRCRFNDMLTHFHGQCYGLVITTNSNMSKDAFAARYGARVMSRVAEDDGWLEVSGPDLRLRGRETR